jgi:hypothetical protein
MNDERGMKDKLFSVPRSAFLVPRSSFLHPVYPVHPV